MTLLAADGLPTSLTTEADRVGDVWRIFLIIALAVGVLVFVLVGMVLIRFRRRSDSLPRQTHYRIPLEIAYTVVPLLMVFGLFGLTLHSLRQIDRRTDNPDLVVHVVGFQWQWQFSYPESGVVVTGTNDTKPVLLLPAGETVRFELESVDVVHSFWLPGFRFERDLIPGRSTSFDVRIKNELGVFPGYCAEFCGLSHSDMTFSTEIVTPDAFQAWLATQAADNQKAAS